MATKKYLSYDGLTEYDTLIKTYAETALSNKQDKLTGVEGQFVGFDAEGNAVAQYIPKAGADEAVEFLLELGMITPISDGSAIYTIDENNILII